MTQMTWNRNRALRVIGALLVCSFFTIGLAPPASAETFVYTYTGNEFNQWYNGATCPPLCSISGYFTLSTPFVPFTNAIEGLDAGPGYSGTANPLTGVVPLTYSFTDGLDTLTPLNSTASLFLGAEFSTIPQWSIEISGQGVVLITTFQGSAAESSDVIIQNGTLAALLSVDFSPGLTSSTCNPTGPAAPCAGDPGAWTVAVTPEPGAFALTLIGVALLVLMMGKRIG
jgi:hypothetical protein